MERIVKTFPRGTMFSIAAEKWQIVWDPRGYFPVEWLDVNAFTPEERAEYERDLAQCAEIPDSVRDPFEVAEQAERAAIPRFPREDLAVEWANLIDREVSLSEDMSVMHAPGECYRNPMRAIDERRRELLALADWTPEPAR